MTTTTKTVDSSNSGRDGHVQRPNSAIVSRKNPRIFPMNRSNLVNMETALNPDILFTLLL